MSESNREKFLAAYVATLTQSIQKNPELYLLKEQTPEEGAKRLANIMFDSLIAKGPGSIMRTSPAFKSACKQVGAANTVEGLRTFLGL